MIQMTTTHGVRGLAVPLFHPWVLQAGTTCHLRLPLAHLQWTHRPLHTLHTFQSAADAVWQRQSAGARAHPQRPSAAQQLVLRYAAVVSTWQGLRMYLCSPYPTGHQDVLLVLRLQSTLPMRNTSNVDNMPAVAPDDLWGLTPSVCSGSVCGDACLLGAYAGSMGCFHRYVAKGALAHATSLGWDSC